MNETNRIAKVQRSPTNDRTGAPGVATARASDAPQRLVTLTDIDKAKAIAAGLTRATGQLFMAEVEFVRYGAFDREHVFRHPAEIRVNIRPSEGSDCGALQAVTDTMIAREIAAALGQAAGESYMVRTVDKRYDSMPKVAENLRLTVQIARAPQ